MEIDYLAEVDCANQHQYEGQQDQRRLNHRRTALGASVSFF
jgi:hypothetical protein